MEPEKRKRRIYTKEFKEETIRLVYEEGHGVGETAERLGISSTLIGRWRREMKAASEPGALTEDERKELKRLHRENRHLEMEREILKKATVFFAKETP